MVSPRSASDRAAGSTLKIISIGRFPASLIFIAVFVLCGAVAISLGYLSLKRTLDLKSLVNQGFTHLEDLLLRWSIAPTLLSLVALLAFFVVTIIDLERNQDVARSAQRPQPESRRTTESAGPDAEAKQSDGLIGFKSKHFLWMLRHRTTFIPLMIAGGLISLWFLLNGVVGGLRLLDIL